MNNIQKYAGASCVSIEIFSRDSSVHLSVKDDGVGFDTSARSQGIGLRNMKNRLEVENGLLTITSSPGHGCELVASFMVSPSSPVTGKPRYKLHPV